MIILGLTGSIAMGKSATARMFEAEGVPVFDADAEVHRQYQAGAAAAAQIAARWPGVMTEGAVDRTRLSALMVQEPALLSALEAIVHPIVRHAQQRFLDDARARGTPAVMLDIPLLFETNRQNEFDKVIVVSAPESIQRQRALARPGMTEAKLNRILERQMPDAEKRAHADFVVDTSQGFDHARAQVRAILASLADKGK